MCICCRVLNDITLFLLKMNPLTEIRLCCDRLKLRNILNYTKVHRMYPTLKKIIKKFLYKGSGRFSENVDAVNKRINENLTLSQHRSQRLQM